jgi:hypothetical protein
MFSAERLNQIIHLLRRDFFFKLCNVTLIFRETPYNTNALNAVIAGLEQYIPSEYCQLICHQNFDEIFPQL